MVDFNGFDKGVIGKKLPADTTLNCMKKSELIKLLHLAEDNHRVLVEAYLFAVDTNKCNTCPLELDKRRADEIRAEAFGEFVLKYKEFQNVPFDVSCDDTECDGDCINCFEKWYKEQKHEKDETKA